MEFLINIQVPQNFNSYNMMIQDFSSDWRGRNTQNMSYNSQFPSYNCKMQSEMLSASCYDPPQYQNMRNLKINNFSGCLNRETTHDSNKQVNIENYINKESISKQNSYKFTPLENYKNFKDGVEIKCSPLGYSENFNRLLDEYCRWEHGNRQCLNESSSLHTSHSVPVLSNFGDEKLHWNTSGNLEVKGKISKSDYNLELLQNFEYSTEVRTDDADGKEVAIYICKYNNCNKEFTRTWNILDHARVHMGVKPFTNNYL